MELYIAGEFKMARLKPWERNGEMVQPLELHQVIKRRLYSYFYHNETGGILSRDVRESIKLGQWLFLDSGAFSAFTKGAKIDINKYAAFINKHGHHFRLRANLDDIGDDGPKSWENMKYLESCGCKVFPVFHHGDQIKYLTKILDEGYDYMALGGLVGASTKVLQEWLDNIWGNYLVNRQGEPRIKVHGFGLTSFPLTKRYPWQSVDSSSAVMTSNFGACLFIVNDELIKVDFSEHSPSKRNIDGVHYDAMPGPMREAVDRLLHSYNINAKQLSEHYTFRNVVNMHTYQSFEKLHIPRTFHTPQPTLFA